MLHPGCFVVSIRDCITFPKTSLSAQMRLYTNIVNTDDLETTSGNQNESQGKVIAHYDFTLNPR
jgi:hypothetical protein